MEFERRERFARHIDLTALVDIVFHLMVFFMLTTSFAVVQSMELTLPSEAKTTPATTQMKLMRILIAQGGAVTVDERPMTVDGLQMLLAERIGNDPDTNVVIYTAQGVSVQQLVSVLDLVYFAGGRNVQVDKVDV